MLNSVFHLYRFLDLLYINVEFSLFATGIVSWINCTSMLNSAYLPLVHHSCDTIDYPTYSVYQEIFAIKLESNSQPVFYILVYVS